jgi:hypothetical protein
MEDIAAAMENDSSPEVDSAQDPSKEVTPPSGQLLLMAPSVQLLLAPSAPIMAAVEGTGTVDLTGSPKEMTKKVKSPKKPKKVAKLSAISSPSSSPSTTMTATYNVANLEKEGIGAKAITGGSKVSLQRNLLRKICHVTALVLGGVTGVFGVSIAKCWKMFEEEGQRGIDDKQVLRMLCLGVVLTKTIHRWRN